MSRTPWLLAAATLVTAAVGIGYTQAPPPLGVPPIAPPVPEPKALPAVPVKERAATPDVKLPPTVDLTKPAGVPGFSPATGGDESIDKLIEKIAAVRGQKAELERQEQELVTKLKDQVKKQNERLEQLGIKGGEGSSRVSNYTITPH